VSDASTLEAVKAAAGPIEAIGATYMLHPETFERTAANGYPHPFAGYFVGRGGVLGDAPAEVVTAVFQVFEPGAVTMFWEQGVAVHGARKGAELYSQQIDAWAQDHLKGVPNLERLVEIGQKLVAAAPTHGLPVFAGWKALPLPASTAGKALQLLITIRELRGGIHLAALTAAGLTPVESHMLNKGAEYCAMFGWPEPYPSVDHLKAKREEVEEITNQREADVWSAALTPAEAQELAGLSAAVLKACTS